MSISLGLFDVFTYTVPGSLYLTLLTYASARLGWIDPAKIVGANTTLIIIAAVVACYLIGHVSYIIGRAAGRVLPIWKRDIGYSRSEFIRRVPTAKDRPFLAADWATLQAAIEVRQLDIALEITRLRAVGLMLRNSAPAFAFGAVVAMVEVGASNVPGFAACLSVALLFAAASTIWQAGRLTHWGNMKTFEVAFWIPEIDAGLHSGQAP